jgi:uncharacterized protein (DUF697 family)
MVGKGGQADRGGEVDRETRCELIVTGASGAAAIAAGASVFPGADAAILMPIQISMVVALSREFGVAPSESLITSTVYATVAQAFGKSGAGLLLRWTPVAGSIVRGGVAATMTQAIGRLAIERLRKGAAV